jgi:hypothetical protein
MFLLSLSPRALMLMDSEAAPLSHFTRRIVIGVIAAVCAVLIPGEAGRLMTTPLQVHRRTGTRAASRALVATVRARSAA